jgi:hypothetical protein
MTVPPQPFWARKITLRNLGTKATDQSATTGSEDYSQSTLPASTCELKFEASGLKTLANILVAVSETVRVGAALPVSESKESITVSEKPADLQTDNPVVGVVLQNGNRTLQVCSALISERPRCGMFWDGRWRPEHPHTSPDDELVVAEKLQWDVAFARLQKVITADQYGQEHPLAN